jgi:hypothetical protein
MLLLTVEVCKDGEHAYGSVDALILIQWSYNINSRCLEQEDVEGPR